MANSTELRKRFQDLVSDFKPHFKGGSVLTEKKGKIMKAVFDFWTQLKDNDGDDDDFDFSTEDVAKKIKGLNKLPEQYPIDDEKLKELKKLLRKETRIWMRKEIRERGLASAVVGTVAEIPKGGSEKKNTHLADSDIDCLIVIKDELQKSLLDEPDNIATWTMSWIVKLSEFWKRRSAEKVEIDGRIIDTRAYSLQMEVWRKDDPGTKIELDILPFPQNIREKLNDKSKGKENYEEICSKMTFKHRKFLSTALSGHQVDFVKEHKTDVIRLMKQWVQLVEWKPKEKYKPSSYAIELMCIWCRYEKKLGEKDHFDIIKAVFEKVSDAMTLEIGVSDLETKEGTKIDWYKPHEEIRSHRPLLVDQANPLRNVAASFDWLQFEKEAKENLEKNFAPMLDLLDKHLESKQNPQDSN
eukprot:m.345460 g.345460  ORF g.345460 m.345460 type:complete len:412 (+) comp26485_c0_seq1:136-1371(+)